MAVALAGVVLAAAVIVGLVPTGPGVTAAPSLPPGATAEPSLSVPTAIPTVAPTPSVIPTVVPPSAGGQYVVQAGDTLSGIADRVGVPWQLIAQANNIQPPDYIIQLGQILTIPVAPTVEPGSNQYMVLSGDTITGIAQKTGVSPSDLADYNNIADWNSIYPGQILYIPGPGWTPLPTVRPTR